MYYNQYYGMMNETRSYGLFMGLCLIVLVIVVISITAFLLSKQYKGKNNTLSKPHMDIIKERYAKGEITKEQFDQMKKDIE